MFTTRFRAGLALPAFLVPAFLAVVMAAAVPAARADDAPPAATGSRDNLRDTRYCEIVPVFREGLTFHLDVYNTLGQNDCPADVWKSLSAKKIAEELDAFEVIMNGPRYWLMDEIIGSGTTRDGKTHDFDGLKATQRATVELSAWTILFGGRPYQVRTIDRETVYVYDAGKPVYEITDDEGRVYVMQTYAQIKDPALQMSDLADLGKRLDLPRGWTYSTRVLDAEMRLTAKGEAFLIQDDLDNSYQRR